MLTFIDLFFWLNFFYFFVATFIAFFVPGQLFLYHLKLTNFQKTVLGIALGMVFWGLAGLVFGYLQIRWMIYFYLVVCVLIFLYKNMSSLQTMRLSKIPLKSLDIISIGISVLGVGVQLLSIWFNGVSFHDGLYFCCGMPDSMFHLALTGELIRVFPPFEPGIASVELRNYHFLTNLIVADLVRVFHLPLISTFSQYFTFLITVLMGLTIFTFTQIAKLSRSYTRWLLLFLFFSGDILYVFLFLLHRQINFDMTFLHNAFSLWVSPSRVLAIPVFFSGLSFFMLWIKDGKIRTGILMAILFGALISIKTYVGIFVLVGLSALAVYYFFKKRFYMVIPIVCTGFLSMLLYLPVNSGAGGFVFTGFWRYENFIMQPSLNLSRHELARLVYFEHKSWIRVIQYEFIYVTFYFIANFGTLLLGMIQTKKSLSSLPKEFHIFFLSGMLISLILGSFFIQKTGGANSVQFLITLMILISVYAALSCSYWVGKIPNKFFQYLLIILVVLFTIARVVHEGYLEITKLSQRHGFILTNEYKEMFSYMKTNVDEHAIILSDNSTLGFGDDCTVVTVFSERQTFFCNGGAPGDRGIITSEKTSIDKRILDSKNPKDMYKELKKNNISYLLLAEGSLPATTAARFSDVQYKKSDILLLKVRKTYE